ncbi:hypothetical protein BYT27DRAFT_7252947 [Phlegmacium glaucopus]|nr:hypothetical protein BYT27DRAFT_7252947 [Phlegmacium glaucopus]
MTFAVLRSLHTIVGEALDDIERIYASHGYSSSSEPTSAPQSPGQWSASSPSIPESENSMLKPNHKPWVSTAQAYASPPPSPSMATHSQPIPPPLTSTPSSGSANPLDFPSLDVPCDQTSLSEALTTHPVVLSAISRIIAAAGQMSATVQTPFLSLCDATMGYHLPSCMRMLEASHVVEILREAGPSGLHVRIVSERNGVETNKLAHILRLLATHHILREVSPDVFALNRISSLVDSGKTFSELKQFQADGRPEQKYHDSNGIAAFVGLCTDEIQKASAYMTETYFLSSSKQTREGQEPTRAPFCFAFDTVKTQTGFFGWLEGAIETTISADGDDDGVETGPGAILPPSLGKWRDAMDPENDYRSHQLRKRSAIHTRTDSDPSVNESETVRKSNRFRLERFGKAMSGTESWEAPGAVLNGFDWNSLPQGGIVVDVGGGIGSTSRLLASAFSSTDEGGLGLKFIIQDRPVVVEMGDKVLLGRRNAQNYWNQQSHSKASLHDFFTPQPVQNAAVFLLRAVLHDWPDDFARRILLQLREAATNDTKLLVADFILPLACPDDTSASGGLEGVEGAESILAPAPLLSNLGRASANGYWMDLTMQVMFNSQERTLREIVVLAASSGWKVVRVTKTAASLFGHIVAVPAAIPIQKRARAGSGSAFFDAAIASAKTRIPQRLNEPITDITTDEERKYREEMQMIEQASSRCGTPTFGSRMELSSVEEALSKFGGGVVRPKVLRGGPSVSASAKRSALKPAVSLTLKKKPSPLSVPPPRCSPPLPSPSSKLSSPGHDQSHYPAGPTLIQRRLSLAQQGPQSPSVSLPPLSVTRQPPPLSPMSPRHSTHTPLSRRPSQAQLSHVGHSHSQSQSQALPTLPSLIPIRSVIEPMTPISHREHNQRHTTPVTAPSQRDSPRPMLTRRSSYAQLPQVPSRKRSGTVVGPSIQTGNLNAGFGAEMPGNGGLITGVSSSRGGTGGALGGAILRFEAEIDDQERGGSSTRPQSPAVGGVSVLAAAARIERGDFSQPPSP